jgi:hypothetical protein
MQTLSRVTASDMTQVMAPLRLDTVAFYEENTKVTRSGG